MLLLMDAGLQNGVFFIGFCITFVGFWICDVMMATVLLIMFAAIITYPIMLPILPLQTIRQLIQPLEMDIKLGYTSRYEYRLILYRQSTVFQSYHVNWVTEDTLHITRNYDQLSQLHPGTPNCIHRYNLLIGDSGDSSYINPHIAIAILSLILLSTLLGNYILEMLKNYGDISWCILSPIVCLRYLHVVNVAYCVYIKVIVIIINICILGKWILIAWTLIRKVSPVKSE